jgi:hypothetical protein
VKVKAIFKELPTKLVEVFYFFLPVLVKQGFVYKNPPSPREAEGVEISAIDIWGTNVKKRRT